MPYGNALRQSSPLLSPNLQEGAIIYKERAITFPNSAGDVAKVQTVTPGVATQEITVYRLIETVSNQSVTFTSDATPTAAEVVTGLTAAIRANPVLNGMVSVSGTTTLILTGRGKGTGYVNFNFADNGSTPTNTLAVVDTTAAADSANIPIGRGLVSGTDGILKLSSGALSSTNVFRGVTVMDMTDFYGMGFASSLNTGLYYPADYPGTLLEKGECCVRFGTAVDPTTALYMCHQGTNSGIFGSSSLANSSALGSNIKPAGVYSAGQLGVLKVTIPG